MLISSQAPTETAFARIKQGCLPRGPVYATVLDPVSLGLVTSANKGRGCDPVNSAPRD